MKYLGEYKFNSSVVDSAEFAKGLRYQEKHFPGSEYQIRTYEKNTGYDYATFVQLCFYSKD